MSILNLNFLQNNQINKFTGDLNKTNILKDKNSAENNLNNNHIIPFNIQMDIFNDTKPVYNVIRKPQDNNINEDEIIYIDLEIKENFNDENKNKISNSNFKEKNKSKNILFVIKFFIRK